MTYSSDYSVKLVNWCFDCRQNTVEALINQLNTIITVICHIML